MGPLRCSVGQSRQVVVPFELAAVMAPARRPPARPLESAAGRARLTRHMADVMEHLLASEGAVTREALLRRFGADEIAACFEPAKGLLSPALRALAAA